jgi:hypothetical protein
MNEQAVMEIANKFLAEQANGLGYELDTIERVDGHPSLWIANGQWKSLGRGSIDAPPITVFVDETSLTARFLDFEKDVLGKRV